MADMEPTRQPVPLLDGQRAQEHEDLERELADTLGTWFMRNATICEHTQLISYGQASEVLMDIVGARIRQLHDDYERLYDTLVRRTDEWKGEQTARVAAEQHAAQADAERDAHAHLLEHWADEHIILQIVSGDPVHAAWCYRCRIEKAEAATEQLRRELALAMGPTMYLQIQQILAGALGGRREDGAGAGLVAEIQLLADRMTAAEAKAERLEAEGIDRMADRFMEQTRIRSMEIRNGMDLDLEPARELVAAWVGAARTMLGDAPNYTETRMDVPTDDDPKVSMEVKLAGELERYAFVLQRVSGLTPHEARMKAEAERDRLASEVDRLEADRERLKDERDHRDADLGQLRREVEERGEALADWQRVAGQHQAAMFDAKNRADHLTQQIQGLWTVKTWTNEDRRRFVFVEDLLNALQPDLAPHDGAEQGSLAQQRNAVINLIRGAYADAKVELKDDDPWPTWGPSIDALDILRALGALEETIATTLAGEPRG